MSWMNEPGEGIQPTFRTVEIEVQPGTRVVSIPDWRHHYEGILSQERARTAHWRERAERAERKLEKRRRKKAAKRAALEVPA